jgi:hypothetical protein
LDGSPSKRSLRRRKENRERRLTTGRGGSLALAPGNCLSFLEGML